jgi:hypothetical protein
MRPICDVVVKPDARMADTQGMAKREQQPDCLQATRPAVPSEPDHQALEPRLHGVSPEFAERVRMAIAAMPETRPERIELARAVMAFNPPSAKKIAEAILREIGHSRD